MFVDACTMARDFMRPFVLSYAEPNGNCGSGIGAYVVINNEGWCITANHMFAERDAMMRAVMDYQQYQAEVEKLKSQNLNAKQRKKAIRALEKGKRFLGSTSTWFGANGLGVKNAKGLEPVDLAVFQLDPFDPALVKTYPQIKDPAKPMLPGQSLCRMGYPFYSIRPTYDPEKGFQLPPHAASLPAFPIEGILTRHIELKIDGAADPPPFPLKLIETSSPGLRGQSGGPIFDVHGTIWGIQSRTQSFALGFEPKVLKGDGSVGPSEHQFLNVGWGVHAESICGLLDQEGIAYTKASY